MARAVGEERKPSSISRYTAQAEVRIAASRIAASAVDKAVAGGGRVKGNYLYRAVSLHMVIQYPLEASGVR